MPCKQFEFGENDWFSHNIPLWEKLLLPLAGKELHALEIGSYEGRSTVWLLEHVLTHRRSTIHCIDAWEATADGVARNLDWPAAYARFRKNIAHFGGKVSTIRGRSQEVLRGSRQLEVYDLIYIDGSHRADHVLEDAVLSWRLAKDGAIIIFDDYHWELYPVPEMNPKAAIDAFVRIFGHNLEILNRGIGHQYVIRKRLKPLTFQVMGGPKVTAADGDNFMKGGSR